MRSGATVFLALLAAFPALAQPAPSTSTALAGLGACDAPLARFEREQIIPQGLLAAMAEVESGRLDPQSGKKSPWPWTVNANGGGQFFASKAQAVARAVELLAENVDVVDVGCLQVNLRHHPGAFKNLEEAFDPAANIAYAVRHLVELQGQLGNWTKAVRAYHAPNHAANGAAYLSKVMAAWRSRLGLAPLAETIDTQPKPAQLAHADFEAGQYDRALERYRKMAAENPDSSLAMLGVAMSLDRLGRSGEARVAYRRVLLYDPWNRAAAEGLLALFEPEPPSRRLMSLRQLREEAPHLAEVPARMAEIHAQLGDPGQAARQMAEALALEPERLAWRLNLALLFDRAGQAAQAIAAYESFLADYRPGVITLSVPIEQVRKRLAFLRDGPGTP
ncbi:MAG: tetratricopeptide repeat protein [Rhodospirillales bacterium]|nr:tetratricopeptide repeat protein [Rhodospirillales bacterium]